MPRKAPVAALLALLLAGCAAPAAEVPLAPAAGMADVLRLLEAGGFEVDVPVDVVLVGFAPEVAPALAAALAEPLTIEQAWKEDWIDVPPDPERPPHAPTFNDAYYPNPVTPVARFRVHDLPDLAHGVVLAADPVADADGIYDANAVEDYLASALPAAGVPIDPNAPPLVVLHLPALGTHAWRTTLQNGWLEPVRVFGERQPLLVFDLSAEPDPYVVTRDVVNEQAYVALVGGRLVPPQDYDWPMGGDASSVEALARLAVDATNYRLLQAPAVPPTTKPCHGVTLILARRATDPSRVAPGALDPEATLELDMLRRGWENLTGEGRVHVDFKLLNLPQDDPALDLLTRNFGVYGASRGLEDGARRWISMHWDRYWVPHEGCEGYVSVVIVGDAADGGGGIALYDVKDGRRMSLSWVPGERLVGYGSGPLQDTLGRLFPGDDRRAYWEINYLFAHETGHILGQHHPHNNQRLPAERIEHRSFSSVWTSMSYQAAERVLDFGAMERANHLRNAAGFAVAEAQAAGLADDPAFEAALAELAQRDWEGGLRLLQGLLYPPT